MKRPQTDWARRFDALARRERWLVAATALVLIVLAGYLAVIDPALKRARAAENHAREHQTKALEARARGKALQSAHNGPEIAAQVELEALRTQLGAVGDRLASVERSLVPPQRMAGLLEDVLGHTRLRLVSMRTLPAVPMAQRRGEVEAKTVDKAAADKGADKPALAAAALYKHGIEIKVEGSYEDLVAYLERLERSEMKLLWNSVSLAVDSHPNLVLTLTVYTLSLDKTWLIV